MCDTRDEPDRERRYLDMLLSRQVAGLIVAGRRIESWPSIGVELGVPVVYAMTQSMDTDEPAILPDDLSGEPTYGVHTVPGRLAVRDRRACPAYPGLTPQAAGTFAPDEADRGRSHG